MGKNLTYSPDHMSDLELPPEEGEILPGGHANTKPNYLVCVCMQRMKFCPNFFVMLQTKYFFTHDISHDLRFKLALTGLTFLATAEALKTDLSDTFMLVFRPLILVRLPT